MNEDNAASIFRKKKFLRAIVFFDNLLSVYDVLSSHTHFSFLFDLLFQI